MGKYLDIVRKVEAKQQAEGQAKLTSVVRSNETRTLYHQSAESVADDCWAIDPHWLVDHQPDLWQRLCWLDFKASEFERRGETEADYKQVLERIAETVKEARELYEQAMSKETAAS